MGLNGLVDYIQKNLPSEAFAYIIGEKQDGRKFKVLSDTFIISTVRKDGFVRVVRDIRMTGHPLIEGEINSCRALYLYEVFRGDVFNYRTKYIFE